MGHPAKALTKYRFGAFEFDRATAELRKRGILIKLQEQPFRILCLLLDQQGEVVTREAICEALWPHDTFVEFDRSLNAAVSKLRQALNDSAENPRFIETVARRGYRFIAPVEAIGFNAATPEIPPAEIAAAVAALAAPPKRKRARILIAASLVASIAMGVLIFGLWSGVPAGIPEITRLTFDSGLTTEPAVSPDGKLLAYASDRDGNGRLHLWVQQLTTEGQAVQLTRGDTEDHQPSFSPDGSKLVFRSERDGGGLYVVPTIGGEATFLAKEGRDPRFSPDGRWVAYWTGMLMTSALEPHAGTTYLVSATGGTPRQIHAGLAYAGNPVWSPDSRRLLVFGIREKANFPSVGGFDWWVVPIDGASAIATGSFAYLKKRGFTAGWGDAPRLTSWGDNELLFSGRIGDSVNLWSTGIDKSARLVGEPRRLTSGTGLNVYPTVTKDGRLIFANVTESMDVWMQPMDTNRCNATGEATRVTKNIGPHQQVSLSADGKLAAYSSARHSQRPRIWLKNLEDGKERLANNGGGDWQWAPVLSADGSLLVYLNATPTSVGSAMFLSNGTTKKFCSGCSVAYDVSPDNRMVIYRKDDSIRAFDLSSDQDTLVSKFSKYELYQFKFSSDARWLLFETVRNPVSRIFAVALRDASHLAPESEWIPVTSNEGWADKPRWSPDGNTVYFVSNRDGRMCLWAQKLEHRSKRPMGEPVSIAHFHESRFSMGGVGLSSLAVSVARDKIAFNLAETTGNIWMTSLGR